MATDLPVHPYRYTEDDTGPPIDGQLGPVASPVDIVGHTFALQIVRPPGSSVLTKVGAIVGVTTLGTFRYGAFGDPDPWIAGDLVAGEKQKCKSVVTDGNGTIVSSQEFVINVDKKLA